MAANRVGELKCGDDHVAVGPDEAVVMGGAAAPEASCCRAEKRRPSSGHRECAFRFDPPKDSSRFRGRWRGWSSGCCVPAAPVDHHQASMPTDGMDMRVRSSAKAIWRDICQKPGELQGELPPWQIGRERRATFE